MKETPFERMKRTLIENGYDNLELIVSDEGGQRI